MYVYIYIYIYLEVRVQIFVYTIIQLYDLYEFFSFRKLTILFIKDALSLKDIYNVTKHFYFTLHSIHAELSVNQIMVSTKYEAAQLFLASIIIRNVS